MDDEYKIRFYTREAGKCAAYSTNFDLFQSKAASWRDTLQVRMSLIEPDWEAVSEMCRQALKDWDKAVVRMSPIEPDWEAVPEMCRQALKDWDKAMVSLGEELMSILCEGLRVKSDKLKELTCLEGRVSGLFHVKCGEDWAAVEAVPDAIVINIGDLLQYGDADRLGECLLGFCNPMLLGSGCYVLMVGYGLIAT
ncbi:oxoglutarate/iron-dependent dioxygenase [Artemisia annua]|uniref:Oxoglutarate/iron-dependent dioxygenase n=1 Tax=Artemisia annua TaxID=35608 RepID=A0A2U1P4Q3_ARTAN|nr:oxoglutarate/iron-dependent dioxygenase [Artemisia annua]